MKRKQEQMVKNTFALSRIKFALALLLSFYQISVAQVQHRHIKVYSNDDQFHFQCKNPQTGEWGPGPVCLETGEEMQLFFGVDGFQKCAWHIDSMEKYTQFAKYVGGKDHLACRVPMVPEQEFYIPFTIPLWGVVEADHTHVGSHMNFIFHADDGKITGVAAYPVLDAFQFVQPGTIYHLHGPIKWFKGHSFQDVSGRGVHLLLGGIESTGSIIVWMLLTCALTMLSGAVAYRYFLRPRLLRKYLKND